MLEVCDISFGYSTPKSVIDQLSFEVADGEVVGLLGPNGAGKSTLIKLIFDLLEVQSGTILISGESHLNVSAKEKIIYLSSEDQLPDFLRGSEYLKLLCDLYQRCMPSSEKIHQLFDDFGMGGRQDDLIENYSHGMRKKVQLLAAFEMRPPIIIIDETMNGLDLDARRESLRKLRELKKGGISIILCSHDFSLIEEIADRAVILVKGAIVDEFLLADLVAQGRRLGERLEATVNLGENNAV